MKTSFLTLSLLLVGHLGFAQYNPEKPDLCQGEFLTKEDAKNLHEVFAKRYSDKLSWQKHAQEIRQGILDGARIE